MLEASLAQCPLFAGIEEKELASLFGCLAARRQSYKKEAYIFMAQEPARLVGIVISGAARVVQEDFWGNRTILAHIGPGGLFGEAFSCAEVQRLPVGVVAAEDAEILLVDYRKIVTVCSAACLFHNRLIANMLKIIAEKNILLTRKMEYLSQRTMRDKLLSFLSTQAVQARSREVTVPFNRQELADFLCVERSALSRELGLLKKEGLLDYERNRFVLLQSPRGGPSRRPSVGGGRQ